jgi:hypothetical protein
MGMTDQEYQQTSDKLFAARESGKIDEAKHERLQKTLDKRYRPDNQYNEILQGKEKLSAALKSGQIDQGKFEKLSTTLDSRFNPDVVDERSELITPISRRMVKNFGFEDDRSLEYLKKENPNVQFSVKGGEILAKAPQDKQWKKLDPSSMEKEDITDILYDVGSGVVEGSAGLLGAAAGPLGVMGASAAAAGGMEALRQGLGNMAGVSEGMDLGQIGTNAALSGVTGGLLGAGKVKGLLPKIAKPVIKPFIGTADAVKGSIARKIGSKLTGADKKDLSYVRQNLDDIKDAEQHLDVYGKIYQDAQKRVMNVKKDTSEFYGRNLSNIEADYPDIEINLDDVDDPLKGVIAKYTGIFDRTNAGTSLDNAVKVEKTLGGLIRERRKLEGPQDIKDYLKELNAFTKIYKDGVPSENPVDTAIMNAAKQTAARVKELRNAKAPRLATASEHYSQLKDTTKPLMKHFKDAPAAERSIKDLAKGTDGDGIAKRLEIKQGLDAIGVDLSDTAYKADIYKRWTNPASGVQSRGGATSTGRLNSIGDTVEGITQLVASKSGLPWPIARAIGKISRGQMNHLSSDDFIRSVMEMDKSAIELLKRLGVSVNDFLDYHKVGRTLKERGRMAGQSTQADSPWQDME